MTPRAEHAFAGQSGTGLIATVTGTLVFLLLVLLATQVTFDLYARSVLGATAFDAARIVAGSDAGASASAEMQAESNARSALGRYGDQASFAWTNTAQNVVLTISARGLSILPKFLAGPLRLADINRTAVVRREMVR